MIGNLQRIFVSEIFGIADCTDYNYDHIMLYGQDDIGLLEDPKEGSMGGGGRGGRCSFFITMRCFNDAMFWNS